MTLQDQDYLKIRNTLPIPTYKSLQTSYHGTKTNIVFELKFYLTSSRDYKWLSDIKIRFKRFMIVGFEFIEDEFYINDNTDFSGAIYTLDELSRIYQREFIKYPKFVYPQSKKDFYQKLSWSGAKLYYQKQLNKEILMSIALQMNQSFESNEKLQYKELYKKVLQVYEFILNNQDNYKQKLDPKQLKEALTLGGKKRGQQIKKEAKNTKLMIKRLIDQKKYLKPNGKPKINDIAKELEINRKTVTRILKDLENNTRQ